MRPKRLYYEDEEEEEESTTTRQPAAKTPRGERQQASLSLVRSPKLLLSCLVMILVTALQWSAPTVSISTHTVQTAVRQNKPPTGQLRRHLLKPLDSWNASSLSPNSLPDTTGPAIPSLIKGLLSTKYGGIDEEARDHYGAEEAVHRLEEDCGWDPETSNFAKPNCISTMLHFQRNASLPRLDPSEFDIVIPTIRDLDFLEEWREFFEGVHIIFVQDGDPDKKLRIPWWVDYELYNRRDIEAALGDNAWIISSKDASIRNFGFLVSQKDYIYTLDDDCLPATLDGPGSRAVRVNALMEHIQNLKTPATPHFFNTLYDPYRQGSDFVRGYPYSLREGVTTAISHGIWMNAPDYDAPTQLLKPDERNTRYAQATITVPRGVLYPMCSMNVAFNRKVIGPAFMQGLMGEGQPWARYDDMFAGWASKVVADHLDVGVKTGAPYIRHNKASNPFTNLKKEYKGLFWQEDLIDFFSQVTFSPQLVTADDTYLDLARQIRERFSQTHPYFDRLATAMEVWVDAWRKRQAGELAMTPSRQSAGKPWANVAVLTVVKNEGFFLPLWLKYYKRFFRLQDMYILDNDSDDGSTTGLPVTVINIHNERYFDHAWLCARVADAVQRLLDQGYKHVLFAEVDEFIVPDPEKYPEGLGQYLQKFQADNRGMARTKGYNILHNTPDEADIDVTRPLLSQRSHWYPDWEYDKPLLVNQPLQWISGFHTCLNCDVPMDQDLFMFHLKRLDYKTITAKQAWRVKQEFNNDEFQNGLGFQHHLQGEEWDKYYWVGKEKQEEIPLRFREPAAF